MCKLLIENGADINARNFTELDDKYFSYTPLQIAVVFGNLFLCILLIFIDNII